MPIPNSRMLALLIEPTYRAIRQGRGELVKPVLRDAQAALVDARRRLRARATPLDEPSYDLGVASTFTALLSTASERSVLADATRQLSEVARGLETLHQVALLNYSEQADASQAVLAEKLGDDPGNFSRRVKKLADAGLVTSERQNRRMVCSLTALGFDVLSDLRPGWRAINPTDGQHLTGEKEVKAYVSENWRLEGALPAVFAVTDSLRNPRSGVRISLQRGEPRTQPEKSHGLPRQVTSLKAVLEAAN